MTIWRAVYEDLIDAVDAALSSTAILYVVIACASWFVGLFCGIVWESRYQVLQMITGS